MHARIVIVASWQSHRHEAVMQIQEGPLAGVKGVQTTIGEYTIDDSEPIRQKVHFTLACCPLRSRCIHNETAF